MSEWRFSANLGFLWRDLPLPDRIRMAARHGFDAVEFHDEAQRTDPAALADALAETGLPVVGLNIRMGDTGGCAAIPGRGDEARRDVDAAVIAAVAAGAGAIHVVAGKTGATGDRGQYLAVLRHALVHSDLTILIEPISPAAIPGYFLNSLAQAVAVIAEVGNPRLRIMYDCFHMAATEGDAVAAFAPVASMVGHVQIASVPDRTEPVPSAIDYAVALPVIRAAGYRGAYGCEYRPVTTVEAGLGWRDDLRARLPG